MLADPALARSMQPIDGQPLSRAPKGFPADSPALDLIVQRQWGVSAQLPAEQALQPTLATDIIDRFTLAASLVAFLNTPIIPAAKQPLF